MNARACSRVGRYAPENRYNKCVLPLGRIQKFFKGGGGLRRKIFKEKCLLIHLSSRVHIKTRQTCNSFSLLPFQEDCLLFLFLSSLFYYSPLFLEIWKEGCNPRNPPLDPPNGYLSPDNVIFELGGGPGSHTRAWSGLLGTTTCAPQGNSWLRFCLGVKQYLKLNRVTSLRLELSVFIYGGAK